MELFLPPQSPDLYPIESFWDVLELILHYLSKNKSQTLIFSWTAFSFGNIMLLLWHYNIYFHQELSSFLAEILFG